PVWRLDPDEGAVARAPRDPQSPLAAEGFDSRTSAEMATSADGTTLVIDWMTGPVELWRRTGGTLVKDGALPIPGFSDLSVSPDGTRVLFVDDDGAALMTLADRSVQRLG